MLRCIGMSKKEALLMLLSETLVLVAIGLAVGFALGIGAYLLTYFTQKNVLGMETYLAFSVHPAVAAVTANPYILPLLSCFICGFLAIIIPAIIELRRSPAEGLQDKPQKKGDSLFQFKNKSLLLGKISGGLLQNLPYYIIVIAVVWTGVFGCTYFAAKTDANTSRNRKELETELHGLDYLAHRKEFYALGNAQLNRHFLGIAPEYAEKVMDHSEVEKAFKVIEIPSTKVIFERGSLDEGTEKILAPSNTAISISPGLDELFYKTLEFQGYTDDEVLYNIPTVAVSEDIMDELSKYLVEGEINVDKLRLGEEILVVRTSETSLFSVGDSVSMNDVIIEDKAAEEYDFEKGGVPEGAEPSFYFKYTDEEDAVLQPGYAFGKRHDFTVKIGGVLEFTDDSLSDFLKTGSVIGRSSFQFICDEEAIFAWGLPDRNYTKIGVILNKKANVEEFEKTWFEVVRNSPDIGSNSVSKIRHKLNNTRNSNSSIFMAIMITVVILGLVGIVNSANLRVRKGLHSFSTARALGLTRNGLTAIIMRQGVICALLGAVTSVIPLGVYEMVRKSAEEYMENGGHHILPDENGVFEYTWQQNFPFYIELRNQPIFLIILAVFAAVCAVILISNIIPTRWIAKKNITEALRNDDF
ncbi:MAG: FtsX-like permease family protein [Oscillospiraceae bacterium]|nr:FtsX-like permease family protein [Oscillospiraceae bacterium]